LKNKIFWIVTFFLVIVTVDISLRLVDRVKRNIFKKVHISRQYDRSEKDIIKLRNQRKKNIRLFNDYVWVSPEVYAFEDDRYFKPRRDSTIALIRNDRIEHTSMLVDKNTKNLLDNFAGEKYLKNYDGLGFRMTGNSFSDEDIDLSILMLGDSFTEGCYVNDEDTFSAWIERFGLKDNLVIKVYNAGVSGYSTREEYYRFVDLVPDIEVDIVMLNYFPNDFNIVEHKVVGYWVSREPRSGIGKWFYSHSMISKLIMKEFYRHFSKPDVPDNNTAIQEGWKESLAYIKKINDICLKKGIVFVVSALPPKEQFSFGKKTYYQNKLKKFCKEFHIVFLDPYEHLKEIDLKLIYLDWDPHFTRAGQMEYGRFLYKKIKEMETSLT